MEWQQWFGVLPPIDPPLKGGFGQRGSGLSVCSKECSVVIHRERAATWIFGIEMKAGQTEAIGPSCAASPTMPGVPPLLVQSWDFQLKQAKLVGTRAPWCPLLL